MICNKIVQTSNPKPEVSVQNFAHALVQVAHEIVKRIVCAEFAHCANKSDLFCVKLSSCKTQKSVRRDLCPKLFQVRPVYA